MKKPDFKFGTNIAFKIPKFRFDETIAFYKDVLGMKLNKYEHGGSGESYYCETGELCLWFDLMENYSQIDIWLEIKTDSISQARSYLDGRNIPFRQELEKLPDGLEASWISDPAGVVLLLEGKGKNDE